MKASKAAVAARIDNADAGDIAEHFAKKYRKLYSSVPSDPSLMLEIKRELETNINADTQTAQEDSIVHIHEVKLAIQTIKLNNSDGDKGLISNHIKYGPEYVSVCVSRLLSSIQIHGYNAHDMLGASIVSIPKDKAGNKCSSTNYRGISLSTCICKIYDIILLKRYKNILLTSDLQFAYKPGHSTSMCTLILKEVALYYMNRSSTVHCCLIDATKA
jgi:hypothetical protein